ncbi:MAG TPA: hypothetical protein VGF23_25125 [Gaiellaceae bacterium]
MRLAVALLAATSALAAVQADGLAAPRPQRATPGKLWSLYPLDNGARIDRTRTAPAPTTPRPAPARPRPKPAPIKPERSSASRSQASGSGFPSLWVGAGAIAVVGLLAGGLALGVVRTRADAAGAAAVAPPPPPPEPAAPPPEPVPPPPPSHEEPPAADRDAALTAERREVEGNGLRTEMVAHEQVRTRVFETAPEAPVAETQPLPTCQIDLWRGYLKSSFVAMATEADGPVLIAESRLFRARGELREDEAAAKAHEALVEDLLAQGWKRRGQGEDWYALRFVRPEPD